MSKIGKENCLRIDIIRYFNSLFSFCEAFETNYIFVKYNMLMNKYQHYIRYDHISYS